MRFSRASLVVVFVAAPMVLLANACSSLRASLPDAGENGDAATDKPLSPQGGGGSGGPGSCDTKNDPKNCGRCGNDCSLLPNVKAGGAVECRNGTCFVPPSACTSGFAHCTSDPNDGCETSISRPESCGSCNKGCDATAPFCASTGGTHICVSTCGTGAPDVCEARCVDLQTDLGNCGGCGNNCSLPNAETTCAKGVCVVAKCKPGYGDCTPEPGCETPLTTVSNCGACGKSCSVKNGTAACLAGGMCGPITCDAGYGNCDTSNPDCETALTTDTHCGSCTTACSGATPFCSNAAGKQSCVSDCPANAPTKCSGKCVDLKGDKNNCGTCGKVCEFASAEASCVDGQCVAGACKPGFGDCTSDPGCETRLDSVNNCGRCGNSCNFANATSSCDGTKCTTPICKTGFGNCDTANPDCETALTMPARCGACDIACGGQTPLCSSSTGKPTCVSDCSPSTPIKCGTRCVSTSNDAQNCGMCGRVCSAPNADSSCSGGECRFACRAGYGDCNSQPGCESNLNGDANNCGTCGKSCGNGSRCTSGQCCDTRAGQSCQATECQTGTYNCAGDCVLKNKDDGTRCGTSNCPAKICKNGVCEFGGINSCPAGQVCTPLFFGCALSGLRSKPLLPNGQPYDVTCVECGGGPSGICCENRTCKQGYSCWFNAGEYCGCPAGEICQNDDNRFCEMYR